MINWKKKHSNNCTNIELWIAPSTEVTCWDSWLLLTIATKNFQISWLGSFFLFFFFTYIELNGVDLA